MTACGSSRAGISVEPLESLLDQRLDIRLSGFGPGTRVTVRAEMPDETGQTWQSQATYLVDGSGGVDLARQAPVSGSFDVADPMGLIWSMTPGGQDIHTISFIKNRLDPLTVAFTAETGGQPVARAQAVRLFVAPGVVRTPVRDEGLVGTYFHPGAAGKYPCVVVVGGSGGGLQERGAALLASHGFAALALAYFRAEHLPRELYEIPLEYFEKAIAWVRAQPAGTSEKLAFMGTSRGGELALLLGSTFPEVRAVVAYVPSAFVHAGIGEGQPDVRGFRASWTYRGEPLFYVTRQTPARRAQAAGQPVVRQGQGAGQASGPAEPIPLTPLFLADLEDRDPEEIERATIKVERIGGPVLLISGKDDQMWPSWLFGGRLFHRLTDKRHPYPFKHLSYAGAGHTIGQPYMPATVAASRHPVRGSVFAYGGNARDNATASHDSWSQVLAFLGQSLKA
jgi:hypothetical protein